MSQLGNFDSQVYCKSARGKETSKIFNQSQDKDSRTDN